MLSFFFGLGLEAPIIPKNMEFMGNLFVEGTSREAEGFLVAGCGFGGAARFRDSGAEPWGALNFGGLRILFFLESRVFCEGAFDWGFPDGLADEHEVFRCGSGAPNSSK